MEDNKILQILHDKGMIDFEGDEEELIMQVPTNIIKTGKFVVDVFKVGFDEGYKCSSSQKKRKVKE